MKTPSKFFLSLEAIRALYEYGLGIILNFPLQIISPKGDGHPVVVIPGLGTADTSTHYVRAFLGKLGYKCYTWGLGRNLGPRDGFDTLLNQLIDRVEKISNLYDGQKVSVIGWSLGGIYAREIAKIRPDLVRQVITLGTPFKNKEAGTNVSFLYELLSKDKSHKDPEVIERLGIPPKVPFTSMYSKTDGVVHWHSSLEQETSISENIEIPGASHLGLGHNPISIYIIADRLAQKQDAWTLYKK
jgi:hypothetical protein